MPRAAKSKGWCVIVFEDEHREFDGEVAFVVGPFDQYEQAKDWIDDNPEDSGGNFEAQIAMMEDPA